MPTLNWIGKEKIIHHHLDVPYRVLNYNYGFTEKGKQKAETGSDNKIIHGDNLEALKSLLPEYEGKVKCIYIDPPYNTGNEGWVYNDNVSHPKLQKWLGETVGKESDDLTRHDKWLCMMYPRLQLLHRLLADDGLIFTNIDDNEYQNLSHIFDEIFGYRNKISTLIWDLGSGTSAGHFTRAHEYIIVYAKNKNLINNFDGGDGEIDDRAIKKVSYKNPASKFTFKSGTRFEAEDNYELTGKWGDAELVELIEGRMVCENKKLKYDVTLKAGYTQKKQMTSWLSGLKTFDTKGQEVIEFYFRKNGKIYCRKKRNKINPPSVIRDLASSKNGSIEVSEIIGKDIFNFPKPVALISYLLKTCTKQNDIILDSFAGSGTTAQAVLNLNKQDGGNRKFILIELENYAETITAERVKRVIKGYAGVEGTGGSFDFYTVGEPLFDDQHNLNEAIPTEKIREYIWYSETRNNSSIARTNSPFLGIYNDTGYYFIYNKKQLTTLDYDTLAEHINEKSERYIIYADNCLLPESFMRAKNIEFKKIPRSIIRF